MEVVQDFLECESWTNTCLETLWICHKQNRTIIWTCYWRLRKPSRLKFFQHRQNTNWMTAQGLSWRDDLMAGCWKRIMPLVKRIILYASYRAGKKGSSNVSNGNHCRFHVFYVCKILLVLGRPNAPDSCIVVDDHNILICIL